MRFHATDICNIPFTEDEERQADIDEANAANPVVPIQISMKQARLALLRVDLYTATQDAIANMAGQAGQEARIVWEYSTTVDRNSALVINVSAALGMDDAHIDKLFMLAATL